MAGWWIRIASAVSRYDDPAATIANAAATSRAVNPYNRGAGWPSHGSKEVAQSGHTCCAEPDTILGSTSANR